MSDKIELQKPLKTFKDIKTVDDLDFYQYDCSVGETPKDIEETCLQLCKQYLCGNWCQQTTDTIQVRRIRGGMINQLYYCAIRSPLNNGEVPQEVVIRLYMSIFKPSEDGGSIRDLVIPLMFSEFNLGPKMYGLFETGQIQKFYKHKQFLNKEQNDPDLVRKVFKALAKIHSLNVPIMKKPNWAIELITSSYKEAFNRFPINEFIDEYNCQTLKKYDLKSEINWITGVVQRLKSPVVFTHNDFRSANLLITEPNEELVVCDFDFARYGYRGYDFICLIREWGRRPMEYKSIEGLPLGSSFRPMIEVYVEECLKIHGITYLENPINSVEHILKEAKTFLLVSYLVSVLIYIKANDGDIEFLMTRKLIMDFSEMQYRHYQTIKTLLTDENVFA